jgi:TolB-like protein/rhodanese-related sulfurtransferase/Flp pilus assembly protein TadD
MAFVLPDQPSIAVLPFTNMSSDPEQEYFADGMTEDLITDLSKLSGLFVVARNSTFTYKGKAVKVGQVAEELGVRYVLEGSVRRAGDQIRINAQLIDALSGGHVWAERYDSSFSDIFALQDNITQKIVSALAVNLTAEDLGRQDRNETDNLEAYDAFLRGWAHYQLGTRDDFAKAVPYYEKAIALDPNYGRAHAALAAIYQDSWSSEWVRSLGISYQEATEKAQYHLQEAMNNPTPLAHQVSSKILTRQNRWDEAIAAAKNAIDLDANSPSGYEAMARVLSKVGNHAEALDFIEKAIRLDPRSDYLYRMGVIQYHLQRYEEAGATMLRATRRNPDEEWSYLLLAAAYGHLGREQEARSAIETFNELRANAGRGAYTLAHINGWSYKEEAEKEQLREGLRKAGLPEGSPVVPITVGGTSPKKIEGAITIDATRAKTLYDRAVPFVDVRDDADWNAGHIPDAVHLELFNVFSEARLSKIVGKNEEVVIHCAGPSCGLSAGACVSAVSWSFTRVYYFRGGFPAWKAAGHPFKVP